MSTQPLVYTINIPDPAAQYADITLEVPSHGRTHIDLMMPRWSPGFYRIEAYAEHVHDLTAQTPEGTALKVERSALQRWRIHSLAGVSPTHAIAARVALHQKSFGQRLRRLLARAQPPG
jgi:predicted metalloprotease with PDZ domain